MEWMHKILPQMKSKNVPKFEYPKIGILPWFSGIDWNVLFNDIISIDFEDHEVVGEDIIRFDNCVIYEDLVFLKDINTKLTPFWSWTLDTMKEGWVFYGPWRTQKVFFVSGHPFTSEFGSYVHHALSTLVAEEMGADIKHGVFQSDDNLVFYDAFDIDIMSNTYNRYGYPIKEEATHVFSIDGMVSYLRNWIGYIFNDTEITFTGDMTSRYINMIHRERGSPEIFFNIANDVNVDALIGQLASFSVNAASVVKPLFERLEVTDIGREAKRALVRLRANELGISRKRFDVPVGFRPDWLVDLV
jgi:hypothetical protein